MRAHTIATMMGVLGYCDRLEVSPMAKETTGNEESADQPPTQQ
jgi:hypothetical protein